MTTHVVLLRGINVGTAKRVSMPDLRAMATNLGYANVATHINSGNLLLTTEEETETVRRRVEQGIEKTFELHADVVVRTVEQLAAVLAANPFPDGDPAQVTIAFLAEPPAPDAAQRIAALAADDQPYLLAAAPQPRVALRISGHDGCWDCARDFSGFDCDSGGDLCDRGFGAVAILAAERADRDPHPSHASLRSRGCGPQVAHRRGHAKRCRELGGELAVRLAMTVVHVDLLPPG